MDNCRKFNCSATLYAYVVEVYQHTKLDGNRKKNFCGRTDGRKDGWMDTPEFQSTRSSVGDDLKSKLGVFQYDFRLFLQNRK